MMRHLCRALPLLFLPTLAWAQQYDSGNPSPDEQYVLEVINRARSNPTAEGTRLGAQGLPSGDITEGLVAPDNLIGVRPPLAMNKILYGTAAAHSLDMYNNNFFGHNSSGGQTPDQRMTAAGYIWTKEGENIAEASGPSGSVNATAAQLEDLLMIDAGIAGRGHRLNLLDAYGGTLATPYFREIGISYLHENTADTAGMTDLMTQDFGISSTNPGPFLLGVIYNDANGNNFYDQGEGISGITVNIISGGVTQAAYAITATAGGYVVPIPGLSGNLTVQISGGALTSPFQTTFALPGENVKVDFFIKGTVASVAPTSVFPPPGGGGGGGTGGGTSSGGGGGGGCGLTGLEGVLILALLRARRR